MALVFSNDAGAELSVDRNGGTIQVEMKGGRLDLTPAAAFELIRYMMLPGEYIGMLNEERRQSILPSTYKKEWRLMRVPKREGIQQPTTSNA